MYDRRKSDRPIVPKKCPNKGGDASPCAEDMEGRGLTKGKPAQQTGCGLSAVKSCKVR